MGFADLQTLRLNAWLAVAAGSRNVHLTPFAFLQVSVERCTHLVDLIPTKSGPGPRSINQSVEALQGSVMCALAGVAVKPTRAVAVIAILARAAPALTLTDFMAFLPLFRVPQASMSSREPLLVRTRPLTPRQSRRIESDARGV
jgi:hypothetical protein